MDTATAPPGPLPLSPAVAPSVQLSFTVLYTLLYGALFLWAYIQLWLLLVHRHKRWSFQSAFLFLCALWAALRTTLFSFYFRNAVQANHLQAALYWLLYCFPVCLQFFTFSLINLYFTQVLLKVREIFHVEVARALFWARSLFLFISLLFLSVNVACAALEDRAGSVTRIWTLVLVRVLVNDGLFIINAILLSIVLMLLTRHSHCTSPYLLSKGTSVCRTAAVGAAVVFLFTSRACYNLTALILSHRLEDFNYDWYNVSDQADLQSELGDRGFLVFGAILFIWELLPMSLLLLIFRIRRPPQERAVVISSRPLPRPYFFDDPQGGDEEVILPWARTDSQQSLNSSWLGSESTPLLFAAPRHEQNDQHHSLYSTPQNT